MTVIKKIRELQNMLVRVTFKENVGLDELSRVEVCNIFQGQKIRKAEFQYDPMICTDDEFCNMLDQAVYLMRKEI